MTQSPYFSLSIFVCGFAHDLATSIHQHLSVLSLHFTNRLFLPHIIFLAAAAIISVSLVLISCECSSVSDLGVSIFIGCGPSCLCLYAEIAWQSINVPRPIQKQRTPQINAKSNFLANPKVARNVKLSDSANSAQHWLLCKYCAIIIRLSADRATVRSTAYATHLWKQSKNHANENKLAISAFLLADRANRNGSPGQINQTVLVFSRLPP